VLRQIGSKITRVAFLEEAEHISTIEERIKGYKVRGQYQALEGEEKKAKREAIAQVMLRSLRRQGERK